MIDARTAGGLRHITTATGVLACSQVRYMIDGREFEIVGSEVTRPKKFDEQKKQEVPDGAPVLTLNLKPLRRPT